MQAIRLLIALHINLQFDREAFLGIARDAGTYGNVVLHMKHPAEDYKTAAAAIDAHAVIVTTGGREEVDEVAALGLPSVNMANYLDAHALLPVVGNDDIAIGERAAAQYIDAGFKHFAYLADATNSYFFPRRDGFVGAVRAAGFECHIAPPLKERDNAGNDRASLSTALAARWLQSLPKPLGLFCAYDGYAREAINACKLADLQVPEAVSVIGVDDDPILCMSMSPQIASIPTSAAEIGRRALELALALSRGEKRPPEPLLIPPGEIVLRESCVGRAIDDDDVAAAVNFIRVHVRERLTVAAVANAIAVSRRTLERKFHEVLQRSPNDEIRLARIAHAKRLLAETDLDLTEVARRSGMIRAQRLANLLKQDCGFTPMQYRNRSSRG